MSKNQLLLKSCSGQTEFPWKVAFKIEIMFSMEYVEFSFRQNMWNSDFHKICEVQFLHIPQIMWNTFALQWMKIRFPWFPQNLGNSVFYNFHRFYGNQISTVFFKIWVIQCFTTSTDSMEIRFPHFPQNPGIIFYKFHK